MTIPASSISPCTSCPKRASCKAICAALEKVIPAAPDFSPFQEITTDPSMMDARNRAAEPITEQPLSWRWADIADEVRPQLQRAIDEILTNRQRQIILMILDGHRQVDIARQFNVRRVTVHWIFKRAKQSLWLWFGGNKIQWRNSAHVDLYPGDIARRAQTRRPPVPVPVQLGLFPFMTPLRFPTAKKRRRSTLIVIRFYRGRPVPLEQLPLPFYLSEERMAA